MREFLNTALFDLGGTPVTMASILTAIVIVLVAMLISRVARKIIGRALQRSGVQDPGAIATIDRLVHYAFLIVGLAVALATLGLDLDALFATGAVAAVALAFALQNILQNFVSGLILLAERSITPHDVLEVDGQMVRVETMGIRATIVRTFEDEQIIMPNSNLVQSSVKNLTLADHLFRVRATVGVAYSTDLEGASRVLMDAASTVERRVDSRGPAVLLKAFGDSAILYDVSVWVDEPWEKAGALSELILAIWRGLKAADITIAFPQLDVHVIDGVPQARADA